jgi:hypothetical protein
MNTTWKVSWNHRRYNGQKLMDDYRNGSHTGFIKQSKGLAKMCNLPKMGDIVYISWKKTKVMKCTVVADFVVNEIEINDEYHIGSTHTQLHTRNNTFLMLKIAEVYETPERMLGNQRTWVKIV